MFFKQAKEGLNDWWRYIVTSGFLFIGYFVGQFPLIGVQSWAIDKYQLGTKELAAFNQTLDFQHLQVDRSIGLALMIMTFVMATIFFLLAIKYVHNKSWKGLITPRSKINWPKFIFGVVVWLALSIIFEVIHYMFNGEVYSFNFQWQKVLSLLLVCLIMLPIQTTLEELFFRSYLMKGIGLIAPAKWIPLLVTSILFGIIHGANPEVAKYGVIPMQTYYISAGLILGIMTIMDDGLELAMGVHFATNLFGALLVSYDGAVLQTDSIWKVNSVNAWVMAGIFILSGIIFLWLSKKMFDWGSFKKVIEPIDHSELSA